MRLNREHHRAEARRLIALAWPVVLTSLNWTLMHLIDVAIVGHAGAEQLGFLAASRTLTYISIVMGLAGLTGVLVFVSRADGAGELPETGEYLRQGLLLGFVLGTITMLVLLLWSDPLLRFIGVAHEMVPGGAAVVRAMALAFPFQLLASAASYFLEGVSRPRRVTIVNLGMLPLNAVLAWALVGGHLGLPAWGAVGAALATSTASALGCLAMLVSVWTLPRAGARGIRDISLAAWRRAAAGVPALAHFGWVPAIASGLELAGFSWLIALSTQLGEVAAGAFQAVFSLHNFTFALALGLGSAAGVRVGNAVGACEPGAAFERTMLAGAMAVVGMGAIALLMLVSADTIVTLISSDGSIQTLSRLLLVLFAPFMLFDGLQVVFTYALRSLGDQVAAGINGVIAFFVVTGGLGWVLVRQGVGAPGLIYACAAGMMVAALLQGSRFLIVTRRLSRS